MLAAYIDAYGGAEKLIVGERPDPTPGPDDLLVSVCAASVNPLDFKIREGKVKALLPYKFPLILGNDLAGTVKAVGANVTRFRVGDRIVARLGKERIGAFAELALVQEAHAALAPNGSDLAQSAGLPLAGLTAWQALFELGQLQPGQTLLVHAATGGVGHLAVQLGKWKGAKVVVTASARNEARCRQWGADQVIDYRTQRFEDHVAEADVVLDTLGDEVLLRSIAITRKGGHVISIAALPTPDVARAWGAGGLTTFALGFMTGKERKAAEKRGVHYHYLFMRPDGAQLAELVKLVDAGTLRVHIDRRYSLREAPAAVAHVEGGHALGKVLVLGSQAAPERVEATTRFRVPVIK